MKRFHILCLAAATVEILIVAFVLWSQAIKEGRVHSANKADIWGETQTDAGILADGGGIEAISASAKENSANNIPVPVTADEGNDEENNEAENNITLLMRVKLMDSDYNSYEHSQVTVSCSDTFTLQCGAKAQIFTGGQTVTITREHPFFSEGAISIFSEGAPLVINSIVHRGESHDYEGILELHAASQGIVIINELTLEQYVARVVPAEMPASYGLEAAKLQAVCARTYAFERIQNGKIIDEYGAYADDSVDFQVYNSAGYREVSAQGAIETEGIIMQRDGAAIVPYYFSTSCGYTSDNLVWSSDQTVLPYLASLNLSGQESLDMANETNAAAFLQDWEAPGLESSMAWYRWRCEITLEKLVSLVSARLPLICQENSERTVIQAENLEKLLASGLRDISVTGRYAGGMAMGLRLTFGEGEALVSGELNIRRLIAPDDRTYKNKSQETVGLSEGDYLPSAFFCLVPVTKDGVLYSYVICGGGNGHGIGLSQNAAYVMLEQGSTWQEVLAFFYQGIAFEKIR